MMLRGSSSLLNSSSKNPSLSSSLSSVLPPHNSVRTAQLKLGDDIESYLSAFQQKRVGKSCEKIDWAKLMDSPGEEGDEGIKLELEGATGTSTFLKPQATQSSKYRSKGGDSDSVRTAETGKHQKVPARGDSGVQNVSRGEKQRHSATKSHHLELTARDVQSLETDSWNSDRSEALDTSSLTKEWTEQSGNFEDDKLHGSNSESDWGRHPLANVKTAGESLMADNECQTFSERSAQPVTGAKSTGTKAEVQDSRLSMYNDVHSEDEETGSESEQFQLTRNVFSIDQLEAALETYSDRIGNENDSGFKNLHTLDDFELGKQTGKNREPASSFRSGRTVTAETSETKATDKVFSRSPTKSDKLGEGYSDEEFESASSKSSDVVEEDIAEELSESHSSDIKTEKNVIPKSDHEEGSPPHSMERDHSESVNEDRVSGVGTGLGECKHDDTLCEDYSEFSETGQHASGTTLKSHTTTQAELSSNLDRTPTLNQDHSVGFKAPKNKSQRTSTSDVHDASVQTPSAAAAHVLPTLCGHHYGRECLECSPVVPHVFCTHALEEVTVTSPAIVALNHLLRNQLALTRQFIATSRHATEQFSSGIVPDHHYTTLEETKDYIAKHRPKVLTTKEAKKLVAMEALCMK